MKLPESFKEGSGNQNFRESWEMVKAYKVNNLNTDSDTREIIAVGFFNELPL